ncbi:MAG: HNH endonuclease [Defluviitaleaceae bacterium]|nr:HNH endonuclease [Defluviitaleaceae bacterium]
MILPQLTPKTREREYNQCSESTRDEIVYEYMFNGKTHRWLDENVVNQSSEYSRGYISMSVLHFFGLAKPHKDIFNGTNIEDAIRILKNADDIHANRVVESLVRYSLNVHSNEKSNGNEALYLLSEEHVDIGYEEGEEILSTHKRRERNPRVIKKAKELFKERNDGLIFCEVCGFNFYDFYGERGNGFIEGHHKIPIHEAAGNLKTYVKDIALLCSNCHRMIHRKPFITVDELSETILKGRVVR